MTNSAEASVVLSRDRKGSRDIFRSYKVIIDGQEAGRIKRGQRLEFPLTPGRHVIFLRIDWCSSPRLELDVQPGQTVRLVCAPGGSPRDGITDRNTYIDLHRA